MTTGRYIIWFAIVILWFALISAAQYPIRKRRGIPVRIAVIAVKLFLSVLTAYAIICLDIPIIYKIGLVPAPLNSIFIADAVGDIITLPFVINFFNKNKNKEEKRGTNLMQIIVCAVCALSYVVFGTINMQIVTPHQIDYTSDKITKEYRIVFFSDLHIGSAQSMDVIESTLRKISDEKADIILLGGDIVDEYTTKEEMEDIFSMLGKINATIYFIYGNHDRQPTGEAVGGRTYSDEELEGAIISNGIQILRDEWVSFDDELVILGREAYNCDKRKDIEEIPARPENAFVLAADHSPYLYDEIDRSGADLQLSGHSHAGQLFPMRMCMLWAGYDDYGFYRHGSTDVYVSPGISGWCYPLRTEAGCHYELITLKPAK